MWRMTKAVYARLPICLLAALMLAGAAAARADPVVISGTADVVDGDTLHIGPVTIACMGSTRRKRDSIAPSQMAGSGPAATMRP